MLPVDNELVNKLLLYGKRTNIDWGLRVSWKMFKLGKYYWGIESSFSRKNFPLREVEKEDSEPLKWRSTKKQNFDVCSDQIIWRFCPINFFMIQASKIARLALKTSSFSSLYKESIFFQFLTRKANELK